MAAHAGLPLGRNPPPPALAAVALVLLGLANAAAAMRPAQSAVAARLAAAATTPPPLASAAGSAVCLNDAGQPVDWWLLYKTPGNCGASPWVRGNVTLYVDASTAAGCDSGGTCWQAGSIDR